MFKSGFSNRIKRGIIFVIIFMVLSNVIAADFFSSCDNSRDNRAYQAFVETDGVFLQAYLFLTSPKFDLASSNQILAPGKFEKLISKNSNLILRVINFTGIKDFGSSIKFQIFITSHFSTST